MFDLTTITPLGVAKLVAAKGGPGAGNRNKGPNGNGNNGIDGTGGAAGATSCDLGGVNYGLPATGGSGSVHVRYQLTL